MKNWLSCTFLFITLNLPTLCEAALEDLVDAAKTFSGTIRGQLETVESDPSPAELAEATISYSEAKADFFKINAAEMSELTQIAMGKRPRPTELDSFGQAFELFGEDQEKVADVETANLLRRFAGYPEVEKAGKEFEGAKKIEEAFIKEFEGRDVATQLGGLSFPGS